MSKLERRAEPPATDRFDQLLSDLDGLERLQALQMSLVRQLRRQVEAACHDARAASRGGSSRGASRRG